MRACTTLTTNARTAGGHQPSRTPSPNIATPTVAGITVDSSTIGAVAALAFNLVGIAGGLVVGRAVDRRGPRWPLLISLGGLAAAMIVLAFASGPTLVVAASALVGFGVMGAQFSLYAIAPRYYPAPVRATGSGAAVSVGRVGSIAGPLLAGFLRQAHAGVTETLACTAPVIGAGALAVLLLTRGAKVHGD